VALHRTTARAKTAGLSAPVRSKSGTANSTLQAIAGWYTENVSEISGALPERLLRANVTPRFLQVFGVRTALGRDFHAS